MIPMHDVKAKLIMMCFSAIRSKCVVQVIDQRAAPRRAGAVTGPRPRLRPHSLCVRIGHTGRDCSRNDGVPLVVVLENHNGALTTRLRHTGRLPNAHEGVAFSMAHHLMKLVESAFFGALRHPKTAS